MTGSLDCIGNRFICPRNQMDYDSWLDGDEVYLLSAGAWNFLFAFRRDGAMAEKAEERGGLLQTPVPVESVLLSVLEERYGTVLSVRCPVFAPGAVFYTLYHV